MVDNDTRIERLQELVDEEHPESGIYLATLVDALEEDAHEDHLRLVLLEYLVNDGNTDYGPDDVEHVSPGPYGFGQCFRTPGAEFAVMTEGKADKASETAVLVVPKSSQLYRRDLLIWHLIRPSRARRPNKILTHPS